ncbi:MAG TPA: sensor domain-containing diguanylate cyclase [Gammaproteobacteria bacterium]|nr:sensor domain-containing diguanylate cyclase [Gammaproteobacteria bacterium]
MSALQKKALGINNFNSHGINPDIRGSSRTQLIQENRQLQKQLRALLSNVRQNEEKLKRFQELELRLIACSELFELLQIVIYEYRATSGLEHVSLVLYDPEYELRRILEDEGLSVNEHPDIIFTDNISEIDAYYGFSLTPYLGTYQTDKHKSFFPRKISPGSSIALLPLSRNMELVGSLNLASHHKGRFSENSASDFLQRLAAIVTVCLENVSNQERLKRLGLTDTLTGVNNRRFFDQRLIEEVGRAQRDNLVISCLFFDVDYFKKVNDTYGHNNGDTILREIASLIRMSLRSSDVIARYGGEEFAAILNNTDVEKAIEISERIRQSIAERKFAISDGENIHVTTSIGIATLHAGRYSISINSLGQDLVHKADQCLYEAKRCGRNRIINSTDEPISNKKRQLEMFSSDS